MAEQGWPLGEFLRPSEVVLGRAGLDGVLAWGLKYNATRAANFAAQRGLPLIRLEDAFLRSVSFGPEHPPWGIILDDVGLYYDGTRPSRLETLIKRPLAGQEIRRAQDLRALWQTARVSKYNHAREYRETVPDDYVLVVDQTRGDLAIRHGDATEQSFARMLEAALDENPSSAILLKSHPEVAAGHKTGHYDLQKLRRNGRVTLLAGEAHPVRLIENARKVYCVTSQIGFEALLWGCEVRTFGRPFYAGWQLTQDDLQAPDRRGPASLEQLVHAALIDYASYVHPETRTRCEVEEVVEYFSGQRRDIERFPATLWAAGISHWKRPHLRRFLARSKVRFLRHPHDAPPASHLLVWGRAEASPPPGGMLWRVEDGFLRSIGLGASFTSPLSWAVDAQGIYYDASAPSDLEHILRHHDFTPALRARAKGLRERIVQGRLTKYNLDGSPWRRPAGTSKVILVPGQVESDASITWGSGAIRTNLGLLKIVRSHEPDATVVYKPHPDVVASLRRAGADETEAREWCDEIVPDADMARLLAEVDEVHTLSSLAGFEALLRGKKVVTYGMPFYAGWGLTEDRHALPATMGRRGRVLELDELVAAALILYPLYSDPASPGLISPEAAVTVLEKARTGAPSPSQFRRSARAGRA